MDQKIKEYINELSQVAENNLSDLKSSTDEVWFLKTLKKLQPLAPKNTNRLKSIKEVIGESERKQDALTPFRNVYIKYLKQLPYKEYLRTKHWRAKRLERIKASKGECEICKTKGKLDVHHRTYDTRGEESVMFDLIAMCKECHKEYHEIK